ncbi:MAG: hypothetical protein BGO01_00810 [Armatimonadetes bacterium 55-13]|nr:MGMT family protein [Armatimonadota bacterium]OJU62345.1 MAG: hypothetical protein BGO01_00810 [Armatimonadetes bacterium 55-13]
MVRTIPKGSCTTYGDLGKALTNPVSGLLVGRWMANCPQDIPWWRVVGKDGRCPVWKRDPSLEKLQLEHLAAEGVPVKDGQVDLAVCLYTP